MSPFRKKTGKRVGRPRFFGWCIIPVRGVVSYFLWVQTSRSCTRLCSNYPNPFRDIQICRAYAEPYPVPAGAMDALMSYGWSGNIRELQNVMERSVILSRGRALELAMPETDAGPRIFKSADANGLESERDRILQVLKETRGLVSGPNGAEQRLGMKRTTLQARMKKLGIIRDYQ